MPSDRTKKLEMESLATSPLYAMPRRKRFRGRYLLIALLIAAVGFGIYRELPGRKWDPPWLKNFLGKTVSKPVESRPGGQVTALRPAAAADPFEIRHLTLHSGDAFDKVFKRLHITGPNLADLRKACKSAPFGRIGNNDELLLVLNRADGRPVSLVYLRSGGDTYTLRKNSSGWEWGSNKNAAAVSGATVHCVWSKSFYHSCVACGLPEPLISRLAHIFSSDVNVTSDLKTGDSFSVFYEKYPIESSGEKLFLVLGAEMDVSGKVYHAIGFPLPDGSWDYFDAKGESLERPFSKVPLDYRTLLNGNAGPVFKILRPRFAIMYIVPAGAQVCAVADGVVSAVHRWADGRFSIEIRHPGGYMSWYGNLSACSPGLKIGTPVRRSMVIGSVGSSGSGKAYFDFQFYKYGRPVNFETEEFAPVGSVPETMMAEFAKTKAVCMVALRSQTMTENKHEIPSGKK